MRQVVGLGLVLGLVASMGVCRMASGQTPAAPNGIVADFSAKDLDGKTVNFYSLTGKAYVVDLWATWCAPCKKEIPDIVTLHDKYKAKGVQVVGVSLDDDGPPVVKPFVESNHMDYPVWVGDLDVVGKALGDTPQTIPDTYFLNSQRRVVSVLRGYNDAATIEQNIEKALASK